MTAIGSSSTTTAASVPAAAKTKVGKEAIVNLKANLGELEAQIAGSERGSYTFCSKILQQKAEAKATPHSRTSPA